MAGNGKKPVLVVVQLSGGNDFMNTVIPYTNSTYYDTRKLVSIPQEEVLPFTDDLAFHPKFAPIKEMYEQGDVAIVQASQHMVFKAGNQTLDETAATTIELRRRATGEWVITEMSN